MAVDILCEMCIVSQLSRVRCHVPRQVLDTHDLFNIPNSGTVLVVDD